MKDERHLAKLEKFVPNSEGKWIPLPSGVSFDMASAENPPPQWKFDIEGFEKYLIEQHCDGFYIKIKSEGLPNGSKAFIGPHDDWWTCYETLVQVIVGRSRNLQRN